MNTWILAPVLFISCGGIGNFWAFWQSNCVWSVRVAADLLRSVPERARCSPRHTSTVPSVCVRDISLVYPHSVWNPRRLGSEAFNLNQCVASGYAVLRSYFIVSITPPPPWTSDQPNAENSDGTQHSQERNISASPHPEGFELAVPGSERTADLRPRPRGHLYRRVSRDTSKVTGMFKNKCCHVTRVLRFCTTIRKLRNTSHFFRPVTFFRCGSEGVHKFSKNIGATSQF